MSLTSAQTKIVANELKENYLLLNYDEEKLLNDLGFTKAILSHTMNVDAYSSPVNVWKLKDYLDDKLIESGVTPKPSEVLKNNIYFPYTKTW